MKSEELIEKLSYCIDNEYANCFLCPGSANNKKPIFICENLVREAITILKNQQEAVDALNKLVKKYRKADAFLDAHGWKREGESD